MGLFSKRNFEKNELITVYVGNILNQEDGNNCYLYKYNKIQIF